MAWADKILEVTDNLIGDFTGNHFFPTSFQPPICLKVVNKYLLINCFVKNEDLGRWILKLFFQYSTKSLSPLFFLQDSKHEKVPALNLQGKCHFGKHWPKYDEWVLVKQLFPSLESEEQMRVKKDWGYKKHKCLSPLKAELPAWDDFHSLCILKHDWKQRIPKGILLVAPIHLSCLSARRGCWVLPSEGTWPNRDGPEAELAEMRSL